MALPLMDTKNKPDNKNQETSKDNKVIATDYAKTSGLKNIVNYKDNKVFVGGIEIKDFYIDSDNKAHVDKDEMDAAIQKTKESIGIKENVYDEEINKTLEEIENTPEWSYDPEKDPAYKAYSEMYHREGQRAYEDAYGKMTSLTGGYESSAALAVAASQLNLYNAKLNDKVGELMENSYERYANELAEKNDYLSTLNGLNEQLQKQNEAKISLYNDATEADEKRTFDEAYTKPLYQNKLKKDNYDTSVYQTERDMEIQSKRIDLALDGALKRGYFTDEEAQILGIKKKEDGTYPSPYYADIQKIKEEWYGIGKQMMQDEVDANTLAAIKKAYYGA